MKSRSHFHWYNVVFRNREGLSGHDTLAYANTFFDEPKRYFDVFARNWADQDLIAACEASGLSKVYDGPHMLIEQAPALTDLPEGVNIESSPSEKLVRDWLDISCEAFAEEDGFVSATRDLFGWPDVFNPFTRLFVAYVDGVPASAALLWSSRVVVVLYWVGTRVEYRRRGLGEAVTRFATAAAFEAGTGAVVLQASEQGKSLYERIGYRTVGTFAKFTQSPGSS